MNFLHPLLAGAAIAGISIPIIIHLLMRRRRKPVKWAAMRFLLEAYRQQRRRMKLEQLLLLAARCLLIALAGLAIARPLLGSAGVLGGRGAVTLYLLIDNGLAASASDAGATGKSVLDRHKASALALLDQLDTAAGDRAGLIALGGPAQGIVVPASSGAAALRDLVTNLAATQSTSDISGGLGIVRSVLEGTKGSGGGRIVVAVLSDYLAGSANTERKLGELLEAAQAKKTSVALISSRPAETGAANISVVGLDPTRPVVIGSRKDSGGASRPSPVRVLMRRSGPGVSEAAATTVKLALEPESPGAGASGATPVGQVVVRWAPGQTEATATAPVDVGAAVKGGAVGSVVLTASIDNDAINGDNVWRRPIEVRQSIRVGLIAPRRTGLARPGLEQYEPADWVRLALQPVDPVSAHADPEIEVSDIEPAALDPARLAGLDAVVIMRPDSLPEGSWKRLRSFADSGGLVVITPPAQATVHLWTDAMVRDLALPWEAQREPRVYSPVQRIAADRGSAGARSLLALLDAELQDLVAPVRVTRVLPVEIAGGENKGPSATLLSLTDATPLVLAASPGSRAVAEGVASSEATGRGMVVLIAAALSIQWTDLQSKPLMVPMMQELVRQGVGRARGAYVDIAGSTPEVPARSVELRPVTAAAGILPIKVALGRAGQPMRQAGLWRAVDERGSGRGMVAVNADPAGGRGDSQPLAAIAAWLGAAMGGVEPQWLRGADRLAAGPTDAGAIRSALRSGDDPSKLVLALLITALGLAMVELVLARWFSHAGAAEGGVPA